MGRWARRFEPFYEAISQDIFKFCEAMNFKPTKQQRALFLRVQRGDKRIAVKSGQGPGKTTASVIIGLWRTLRHPDAMTVVTAPTMRQCTVVWLTEARRLLKKADPQLQRFVEITNTKIIIGGREEWGVKTVTATKPEAAQGLHEKNMTIIAEEASGIDRPLIEQFEGTSTNPGALFLQIGNPNTRDCAFFDCFHAMRDFWSCLTFNAEDTARDHPEILSPENHEYLAFKYGRDSDVYRVRVLGEFPRTDPRCIIGMEDAEACTRTSILAMAKIPRYLRGAWSPAKQFGIDYARFGGDESVLARRSGNSIVDFETFNHTEPEDVIARAFAIQSRAGWKNDETWYVSDATGMGQGLQTNFRNAGKTWMEFHNHGVAQSVEFDNKITEAWFHLGALMKAHECHIPLDQRLLQQLTTRQYYLTKKGKMIAETKDEYEKRGFDSPDRADGTVMSFYENLTAGAKVSGKGVAKRRRVLVHDTWERKIG